MKKLTDTQGVLSQVVDWPISMCSCWVWNLSPRRQNPARKEASLDSKASSVSFDYPHSPWANQSQKGSFLIRSLACFLKVPQPLSLDWIWGVGSSSATREGSDRGFVLRGRKWWFFNLPWGWFGWFWSESTFYRRSRTVLTFSNWDWGLSAFIAGGLREPFFRERRPPGREAFPWDVF